MVLALGAVGLGVAVSWIAALGVALVAAGVLLLAFRSSAQSGRSLLTAAAVFAWLFLGEPRRLTAAALVAAGVATIALA